MCTRVTCKSVQPRSFCPSLRTRVRVLRMHVWAHMRARDIRGYQSYAKLQTETAPPRPPATPVSRGPNLHTYDVTHTARFNISGHGWKLSPETQADVRRTIGLANAAIFVIAPASGISRRKRDC